MGDCFEALVGGLELGMQVHKDTEGTVITAWLTAERRERHNFGNSRFCSSGYSKIRNVVEKEQRWNPTDREMAVGAVPFDVWGGGRSLILPHGVLR